MKASAAAITEAPARTEALAWCIEVGCSLDMMSRDVLTWQEEARAETQRRKGRKRMLDVLSALLLSFSSSLRLCVSARDLFFLCRLRNMAASDRHDVETAPIEVKACHEALSRNKTPARRNQA
ncbi:hypothetical protein [Lamprobacter modestohalophilus]|uniref:hypothetical protein n=1 Tax=Lamprobacter modestohalophilus TaxID=1064514 RepID=UPI0019088BEC|nr:hypothetical protein [Lamprobacter modestohalophilus]